MGIVLPALAVAFAAFCVCLIVRIVNRRERWAKRTAVGLFAVAVFYPASSGPAIWLICKGYVPGQTVEVAYSPLVWILEQSPEPVQAVGLEWFSFWAPNEWQKEFRDSISRALARGIFDEIMAEDFTEETANEDEDESVPMSESVPPFVFPGPHWNL